MKNLVPIASALALFALPATAQIGGTKDWETETIEGHIEATRAVFLKYLPPEKGTSTESLS